MLTLIFFLHLFSFSAYRYKALLNGSDGRGPLQTYFLGEKMHEPVSAFHILLFIREWNTNSKFLVFSL